VTGASGARQRRKEVEGTLEQRRLGRHGPLVSAVGLGCMGMSQFYGRRDDDESVATVRRALDLGVTFFDTADMYGPYHNERLLRRALGRRREGVVVATKFGNVKDRQGRLVGVDGRPEHVREACGGSLRRLGADAVDLYYQHRVDPAVPVEETWGALAELVRAGDVRHLGICTADPGTVRRAAAVHPVAAVQLECSVLDRAAEALLPTLRELGTGFVAYAPLGQGLLGGRLRGTAELDADDVRRTLPRFEPGALRDRLALVDRLAELAGRRRATVAQLAIAWVLARGGDVAAIPGSRRRAHLEENLGAASLRLDAEDLAWIDAAAAPAQ